jgi:hypothetical protein
MTEGARHTGARGRGRAREQAEEGRCWSGVLGGLYRGPGECQGGVTASG